MNLIPYIAGVRAASWIHGRIAYERAARARLTEQACGLTGPFDHRYPLNCLSTADGPVIIAARNLIHQ